MQRIGAMIFGIVLAAGLAFAAKEFVKPRAFHANTYPAHDDHPMEHAAIAVDPYDMPDKAAVFGIKYREYGLMPVHFIVSNDGDQPLELANMKVELITHNRSRIQPATEEDLYRRLGRVRHRGDEPSRNPLPVPLPRKGPDMGVSVPRPGSGAPCIAGGIPVLRLGGNFQSAGRRSSVRQRHPRRPRPGTDLL